MGEGGACGGRPAPRGPLRAAPRRAAPLRHSQPSPSRFGCLGGGTQPACPSQPNGLGRPASLLGPSPVPSPPRRADVKGREWARKAQRTRRGAGQGGGTDRATLSTFASPPFHSSPPATLSPHPQVDLVLVPAVTGDFGVMPGHVPTVAQLRPGVLTIHTELDKAVEKYFVAAGFAFVHADSTADVCAVEAVRVEDLDPEAVRAGLAVSPWAGREREERRGCARVFLLPLFSRVLLVSHPLVFFPFLLPRRSTSASWRPPRPRATTTRRRPPRSGWRCIPP